MTQLLYNGKDITQDVEIFQLEVMESAGEEADGIEAVCVNADNQWSGWKPQRGDTLDLFYEGYRSGLMWIDRIRQEREIIRLSAVTIPPGGKTKRTKCWENLTLRALCMEKAADYGLQAEFFGVPVFPYARVEQLEQPDFAFLEARARLEGCTVKVSGGKLAAYSDRYMESQPQVKNVDVSEFFESPRFDHSAACTFRNCIVKWADITGEFTDPQALGPELSVSNIPVSDAGEAKRFAQNLLRAENRNELSGSFTVALDVTMTAGNTVAVTGAGLSDGNYFIEKALHDFAGQASTFYVRRCFERF